MDILKVDNVLDYIDIRFHDIISSHNINIIKLRARDIVSYKRIDILIKIKLLEAYINEDKICLDYYLSLYKETIRLFTDGKFIEPGDSGKNNFDDYVSVFFSLYESIKLNGFDEKCGFIPLDDECNPIDGAHRVAIAYVLDLELTAVKINNYRCKYDIEYFISRGINEKKYDLIHTLLSFDSSIRIAIIWPKSQLTNSQLKTYFGDSLIYIDHLDLNYNGVNNLVISAYSREKWIGSGNNHWNGSWNKTKRCYIKNRMTRIVIFKPDNMQHNQDIKNNIRSIDNGEKHSIHTTDDEFETIDIAKTTLLPYAAIYLNNLKLNIFAKYKSIIGDYNVLVSGSALWNLLGLRKSYDIDVVTTCPLDVILPNSIGSHDHYKYFDKNKDRIASESIFKFVFLHIEFISIGEMLLFKKWRNEPKDITDIYIMSSLLDSERTVKYYYFKYARSMTNYKRILVNIISKQIIFLLKKMRMMSIVKKILNFTRL